MTLKIMVSAPYIQPVFDQYIGLLDGLNADIEIIKPFVEERMSEKDLLDWIKDVDGVICGDDAFTGEVLKAASNLKVISKWGTGIDSIDLSVARDLGIAIRNTPDAFTDPVSDSVLGYMLCFARKIPWMDQDIRDNLWEKKQGFSLSESTLGIIGLGNVGRAVAKRANAFGMRVLGNDVAGFVYPDQGIADVEMVDKEVLLGLSDFVSLNCDLNSSSYHMIGEAELSQMKRTAFLLNTARGPLVDEVALVNALKTGVISGAALDVFEYEPLPLTSELRNLDNCLMAPHNANSSPMAYDKVHKNTIQNLVAILKTHHR